VTTIDLSKARLFIGDHEVVFKDGTATYEQVPKTSEPEWVVESTVGSYSFETKISMTDELRDFLKYLDEQIIRSVMGKPRRGHSRRSRFSPKRTGPYFCGRCVAIGLCRPIMTLYGLRAHMAQDRHGHRGFLRAEVGR
jgi:hypothetical protein